MVLDIRFLCQDAAPRKTDYCVQLLNRDQAAVAPHMARPCS